MGSVSRDYVRRCLDSQGGLDEVYLFNFIKYSRSDIEISNGELRAFPSNTLYKIDGLKTSNYTQNTNFSDQGEQFDQTLNLTFSKADDYYYFIPLIKGYTRALVKDRNGDFRLLGCYNGLQASNYANQSGTSRGELNGFTIALNGKESTEAPYVGEKELIQPYTSEPILASGSILASSSVLASYIEITF